MIKLWMPCLILLIVALSGCTDKTEQTAKAAVTPEFTLPETSVVYVEIKGLQFNPFELRIAKGTTVQWTNMDSAQHVVYGNSFRSPPLNKRDRWSYTFNRSGTFEYSCSVHPSMQHARIIVD